MRLRAAFVPCLLAAALEAAGQDVLYYHHDATGNRVAMTDEAGQVVWQADIRPFGAGTASPASPPLRFLGHEREPDTTAEGGLYMLGARYLDPFLGRFISPDPISLDRIQRENPQRFNLYSYALNNPYRFHDADGRVSKELFRLAESLPLGPLRGAAKYVAVHGPAEVIEAALTATAKGLDLHDVANAAIDAKVVSREAAERFAYLTESQLATLKKAGIAPNLPNVNKVLGGVGKFAKKAIPIFLVIGLARAGTAFADGDYATAGAALADNTPVGYLTLASEFAGLGDAKEQFTLVTTWWGDQIYKAVNP